MKILLIEDVDGKIKDIEECLSKKIKNVGYEIKKCNNLEDSRREIIQKRYDLIIFDCYLPLNENDKREVNDMSSDLINEFKKSVNYKTEAIAITGYNLEEIENLSSFNEAGVTVVHYSDENDNWKRSLELKIERIQNNIRYDFLIFCALTKERLAYTETDADVGELKILNGLDCQKIKIGNHDGLCIVPPRMGLVNMAIIATKAIEVFQPKIVAISGICAGVKGEVNLLDLIIGDVCWEYQTGKIKNDDFNQEPYQIRINPQIKTELNQIIERNEVLDIIKKGRLDEELKGYKIIIGPVSSGSAVIASERKVKDISSQHRKMAGLEMEMYSLYEAADQSLCKPLFFGVKAVVDLGDSSKTDHLHTTASIISARLTTYYLNSKLDNLK